MSSINKVNKQFIHQLAFLTLMSGVIAGLSGCNSAPNRVNKASVRVGIEATRQAEKREAAAAKKRQETVFCYTGRTDNFQEMEAWHQADKRSSTDTQLVIKLPPIESEHASGGAC